MKPSIPRGTRDFGPAEMHKRQYIFDIVKRNFQLFGFSPIETPAMENLDTLTGKYGDEGDKLIFKILDSGEYIEEIRDKNLNLLKKALARSFYKRSNNNSNSPFKFRNSFSTVESRFSSKELTRNISEKALRYDLTVPFARYVVMNQHSLTFPFKRYQIQPVWRADRPQKGRYREFYQCDADIIGSNSLINELELIALMDKTFSDLKIPVLIKLNNRKLLTGIAQYINATDKAMDIAIAIDKMDKIGQIGVENELFSKGFSHEQINKLLEVILIKSDGVRQINNPAKKIENEEVLNFLKTVSDYRSNHILQKGIEELEFLFKNIKTQGLKHVKIELDISLARGLNYYTGTIFEAKANEGTFTPSILGGGRYDDLTGIFGLKNMSGVGISFGIDRIYDVMTELRLFPEKINSISSTQVLFATFGQKEQLHCLKLAKRFREKGINVEIYSNESKIGKQFEYANKKQIPFVCTVGSDEMSLKKYPLKNLETSTQSENPLTISQIIREIKKYHSAK
ncbi:MAG: histidine--tRNA ligase [Bacteroidetes bacterium]|nr:histidine--tRNA ligase [Bacteroidota bacterium]